MHNVTIVYNDDLQESFEALRVIEKGVIIGRIVDGEFLDYGFIPRKIIKEIKM